MYQILLVTFLVVAVALVAMILIQHGKGADMGASFGAGASNTVFGSSGSGNFLTRTTGILAMLFFATALALGYMTAHNNAQSNGTDDIATQISSEETTIPAPVVETGIPTAEIEDVAATEASAIPDAPLDEAVDAVKEIPADKVESTKAATKDPVKDEDK